MSTRAILGIDAGTTAVKSVILSDSGELLGMARSTTHVLRPRPDFAEQDMDEIWRAVSMTIAAALDEAGDVELVSVCVTGQGDGAWLVDQEGRPTGPARLWLDGRAADRVASWEGDGRANAVREITGSALFSGALPVLLEEIEEHHPEQLSAAAAHLNCKDWLRYKLTGRMATDPTEASRGYLDVSTGVYSDELIARLGHERFQRLLPQVLPSTAVAGVVTETAARETGLPVGVPVATGVVDTPASGIGLGVVEPGQAYGILGTTAFIGVLQHRKTAALDSPVITLSFDGRGDVLECFAPMNGTPNLDWAREITGQSDLQWDEIGTLVTKEPAGSGGVLYLPYGSTNGERAPFVDPDASAAWLNLSVSTTSGQLLRAVYEGICSSLRECADRLHLPAGEMIKLSGGGAQSAALCQILADVTQRPIERSTDAELGARGVVAIALVAAGLATDLAEAALMLRTPVERFEPDPSLARLYKVQAEIFERVRDANRELWQAMRALRSTSQRASS